MCSVFPFFVKVDVNIDNLRQSDLVKLPLYLGYLKDQLTAEQWIERISRSCTASAWTDDQTMAFVFDALRGISLRWFDALKHSGIDRNIWDAFQKAFLAAFSTTRTPRTATVKLANLHQGQNESVVYFYPRVFKAVDDLEALAGHAFPLPDPQFPVEFTNVLGFVALVVHVRAAASEALVTYEATAAFNHIALNLFVSNLRPSLRGELLKYPLATLYEAFESASQLERLQENPKKTTAAAMPVEGSSSSAVSSIPADIDASADGLDKKVGNLNFCLKALKGKRNSSRPQPSSRPQQQQQQRSGPPSCSTPARDPNFKCRYCKKLGHGQYECNSRRAAGAPMVAADRTPYKPASQQACVHHVVDSTFLRSAAGLYSGLPLGLPFGLHCCPTWLSGFSLRRVNDAVHSLCSIEPTCNILTCNKFNFSEKFKHVERNILKKINHLQTVLTFCSLAISKHLKLDRFYLFKIVKTILKLNCFKIASLFRQSEKLY